MSSALRLLFKGAFKGTDFRMFFGTLKAVLNISSNSLPWTLVHFSFKSLKVTNFGLLYEEIDYFLAPARYVRLPFKEPFKAIILIHP